MKPLPKKYDHKTREKHWQQQWGKKGIHAWNESEPREANYVIDTPPPTVSGVLHMGHVFSYCHADFIARYQRMSGKNVFYPMGFDDNGLPTERLVEKTKKVRATDMSREDFITLCMETSAEARKEFRTLFESIALSIDWKQEYHTVSEHSRRISQLSFLDLYNKEKVYRQLQPMLWDPVDQTAIAQAEVVDKEMPSHFNDILFGIEGSDEQITIATTRPELIPACVAIFYHPDDERYQHLGGKHAVTPLFGIKVPILEDDTVEPEKGTGIMMCCTFGDEADIEKWRKHKLDTRVILNKFGKIDWPEDIPTSEYTEQLKGKKVSNPDPKHPGARQTILKMLEEASLLVKQEAITHAVKCAERSGAPLEILPTHQWFVKVLDQKEQLKSRAASSTWYPDWMRTRMDQWIDGLNWDWCISRQRYFGVPFPVWYSKREGEKGKILLPNPADLPVNPLTDLPKGYTRDEIIPDADVMDTWATSSVSPQISSHGLNTENMLNANRHTKLYPADLRPQAHEIIRTWAFYTLVKSHYHADSIAWKNLMISGWCLASDKTKMSKSKGNVITPVSLIEEKSADAVRYWTSTSRLGADTAFSEDLLKIGKKLVTKLWNASKFASQHFDILDSKPDLANITETLDKWILTRLNRTIAKATEEFEAYEFSGARVAVEDFFWNDLCDNYLELVKVRSYGEEADITPEARLSAVTALYYSLEIVLRLFAPIVPHITDELYSHIFAEKHEQLGSIHARGNWPKANEYPIDNTAEASGIACVEILNAVRKAKSEKEVSLKTPLNLLEIAPGSKNPGTWDDIEPIATDLKNATNAAEIKWNDTLSGDTMETEDSRYAINVTFAEKAEVA